MNTTRVEFFFLLFFASDEKLDFTHTLRRSSSSPSWRQRGRRIIIILLLLVRGSHRRPADHQPNHCGWSCLLPSFSSTSSPIAVRISYLSSTRTLYISRIIRVTCVRASAGKKSRKRVTNLRSPDTVYARIHSNCTDVYGDIVVTVRARVTIVRPSVRPSRRGGVRAGTAVGRGPDPNRCIAKHFRDTRGAVFINVLCICRFPIDLFVKLLQLRITKSMIYQSTSYLIL